MNFDTFISHMAGDFDGDDPVEFGKNSKCIIKKDSISLDELFKSISDDESIVEGRVLFIKYLYVDVEAGDWITGYKVRFEEGHEHPFHNDHESFHGFSIGDEEAAAEDDNYRRNPTDLMEFSLEIGCYYDVYFIV